MNTTWWIFYWAVFGNHVVAQHSYEIWTVYFNLISNIQYGLCLFKWFSSIPLLIWTAVITQNTCIRSPPLVAKAYRFPVTFPWEVNGVFPSLALFTVSDVHAIHQDAIFGVCNLMGVNMQPTSGEVGGLKRFHYTSTWLLPPTPRRETWKGSGKRARRWTDRKCKD